MESLEEFVNNNISVKGYYKYNINNDNYNKIIVNGSKYYDEIDPCDISGDMMIDEIIHGNYKKIIINDNEYINDNYDDGSSGYCYLPKDISMDKNYIETIEKLNTRIKIILKQFPKAIDYDNIKKYHEYEYLMDLFIKIHQKEENINHITKSYFFKEHNIKWDDFIHGINFHEVVDEVERYKNKEIKKELKNDMEHFKSSPNEDKSDFLIIPNLSTNIKKLFLDTEKMKQLCKDLGVVYKSSFIKTIDSYKDIYIKSPKDLWENKYKKGLYDPYYIKDKNGKFEYKQIPNFDDDKNNYLNYFYQCNDIISLDHITGFYGGIKYKKEVNDKCYLCIEIDNIENIKNSNEKKFEFFSGKFSFNIFSVFDSYYLKQEKYDHGNLWKIIFFEDGKSDILNKDILCADYDIKENDIIERGSVFIIKSEKKPKFKNKYIKVIPF